MIRKLNILPKEKNMSLKTIKQFINENGLTITNDYAVSNPNMDDSTNMNHYKVTIKRRYKLDGNHLDTRYGFKQMTIPFSQGIGIEGEPKLESVLDCLLTDSIGTDGVIFEDFCSMFGYNEDSRKAEKIYNSCKNHSKKLKNLLGSNYNDLIKCERL